MIPSFNNEAVCLCKSIRIYILLKYTSRKRHNDSPYLSRKQIYLYNALSIIYCDITHRAIAFIEQLWLSFWGFKKKISKYCIYLLYIIKSLIFANNCIYVFKLFKIHRIWMYQDKDKLRKIRILKKMFKL